MAFLKDSLRERLSATLPKNLQLKHYHVSTPPTRCAALYIPAPGREPERTFCESHFLLISAKTTDSDADVALYALEVLVYTTAVLTTIFVSKADSTGFASLLNIDKTSPSATKSVTSCFVSWLVRSRHRPDRRLVVSLFARSQGQYLFPGSAEYARKHILDDRGLVKWWCKTLDPVLREYPLDIDDSNGDERDESQIRARAYLVVPGHDKYETTAFFPPSARSEEPGRRGWINADPLRKIASDASALPRSMIPHFPDDPKSRFLDELDEEIPDAATSSQSQRSVLDSPSKRGAGQWKSVKTVEQFWEMMAFRQECSSGRIVGFIWVLFGRRNILPKQVLPPSPSPVTRSSVPNSKPKTKTKILRARRMKRKLTGPITPRPPRVKTAASMQPRSSQHETTEHYHSPLSSRGSLVLSPKAYVRLDEILHRLDFANLDVASASTTKWVREAAIIAGTRGKDWGVAVIGSQEVTATAANGDGANTQTINVVPSRKRKSDQEYSTASEGNVNVLGSSLVRKKAKVNEPLPELSVGGSDNSGVNTLGGSLVRKKPKLA